RLLSRGSWLARKMYVQYRKGDTKPQASLRVIPRKPGSFSPPDKLSSRTGHNHKTPHTTNSETPAERDSPRDSPPWK
ncbi:MAG: hypothetical protein MK133_15125, partial [Planctomycetes bacterium]|nr:hypothetical protein [Planctomycetota bacterium]